EPDPGRTGQLGGAQPRDERGEVVADPQDLLVLDRRADRGVDQVADGAGQRLQHRFPAVDLLGGRVVEEETAGVRRGRVEGGTAAPHAPELIPGRPGPPVHIDVSMTTWAGTPSPPHRPAYNPLRDRAHVRPGRPAEGG